ncbi:hypothetical protein Nmel_014420 [Mimus melanotis]
MGESTSPISVILVSSGSRGNKLLFRFPFQRGAEHPAAQDNKPRSRYAVNGSGDTTEDQDGDSRWKKYASLKYTDGSSSRRQKDIFKTVQRIAPTLICIRQF